MKPAEPTPAPGAVRPLPAEQLYRAVDSSALAFASTADIEPIDGVVGQQRALDAIRFGTRIGRPGFNLFVIGPNGIGMRESVASMLKDAARDRPAPSDWVYVNNFASPDKPIAIELPPGRAVVFRDAMHELIDDLRTALPAVFQGEDYQRRRAAIDDAFQKKQAEAFSALQGKAAEKNIVVLRTPYGFALAPAREGEVVPPDEFNAWPEAKRREAQETIAALEQDLERIVHQIPQWEKARRDEIRKLNRETARFAVDQSIEQAKSGFADLARIVGHIETVRSDLIDNMAALFVKTEDGEGEDVDERPGGMLDRYAVNVLVSQTGDKSAAPVVEELHPTLGNLIGRIEYVPVHGTLVTNFRLIKAGALHRANGGYLALDVRSLLVEPFSWMALKRALRQGRITIEDIGRLLGFSNVVSLDPDPIPLNLKVVLFGDRLLYFLLAALDPELGEHFKVLADFEDDMERTPQNEALLAGVVASLGRRAALKPFDRDAVARVLEHCARLADHGGKLTLLLEQLRDVLTEADFWAEEAGRATIARADVDRALTERIQRAARLRDRAQEAIHQQIALIDTSGIHVGQVNGLSVIELGGFAFGRPTRITCRVRPGRGQLVDIEREVELGGPIHSKGVLILSGFLAGRFAPDTPMSLFASLVFEQSYSGVEGDSASSAELYALLSALADLPLRQDLAVTGSVNQHGEIQAIGGVNEKIEGFFDICAARGLTGTQGVLIPRSNVQHLMLRRDVVEACGQGRFAVYPVASIDEGIALLTGRIAGERGADRLYPEGSVNRLVEDRLRSFAKILRGFQEPPPGGGAV
jgi:lon-related putative ATP-dependent protease